MTSVLIRDESMSGETIGELTVEVPEEQITVHELIRSRVYQEVRESNARDASAPAPAAPLVTPTETETQLNGERPAAPARVDWQPQFEKALAAFRANQIMILIDGQQATSLDESICISPTTRISFLRLTVLMGG